MKLEVGMYVRTKYGSIRRICYLREKQYSPEPKNILDWCDKCSIIKASHNLIDLIEVGDYVNGEKVQEDNFGNLITISSFASNGMFNTIESYGSKIRNEDIEEILTHEQYENNTYKVVE